MNRTIKFRGMSAGGSWVQGDLCTHYEDEPGSVYIIDEECTYHKVIPETVGQFTGLNDKNGIEIWEGDIFNNLFEIGNPHGVVIYSAPSFVVKDTDLDNLVLEQVLNIGESEIVGNVHDNPELLKT